MEFSNNVSLHRSLSNCSLRTAHRAPAVIRHSGDQVLLIPDHPPMAETILRWAPVYDKLVLRDQCPIVGERKRKSNCTCVRDLLTWHRASFLNALDAFLEELSAKNTDETRKRFIVRHHRRVLTNNDITYLNVLQKPYVDLPVVEQPNLKQSITLCRSAAVDIVRFHLAIGVDEAETLFHSPTNLRSLEKKEKVARILRYLLELNTPRGQSVSWRTSIFRETRINTNTTLRYVRDFHLREIIDEHVKCAHHHVGWIQQNCHGYLLPLSPGATAALPDWRDRGVVEANYSKASPSSVALSNSPHPILTRKIDATVPKDLPSLRHLDKHVIPDLALALGWPLGELTAHASFLKSPMHAPQAPHLDFGIATQTAEGKLYFAVIPITPAGCYLQVWPGHKGSHGDIIYVSSGYMLVLPHDLVHGGVFLSSDADYDLRLHLEIRRTGLRGCHAQPTICDMDTYPLHPALLPQDGEHNKGCLHRIFSMTNHI